MKKTKKIIALLVAILTIVMMATPAIAAGRAKTRTVTVTTINTTPRKVKEKSELKTFISLYPMELQTSYANLEIALANHCSLTLITRENGEVLVSVKNCYMFFASPIKVSGTDYLRGLDFLTLLFWATRTFQYEIAETGVPIEFVMGFIDAEATIGNEINVFMNDASCLQVDHMKHYWVPTYTQGGGTWFKGCYYKELLYWIGQEGLFNEYQYSKFLERKAFSEKFLKNEFEVDFLLQMYPDLEFKCSNRYTDCKYYGLKCNDSRYLEAFKNQDGELVILGTDLTILLFMLEYYYGK